MAKPGSATMSSGVKLDRYAQWELLAGCEAAGPADPNLCLPHVLKEENNQNRVALRPLNTGVHVTDGLSPRGGLGIRLKYRLSLVFCTVYSSSLAT